MVGAPYADDHSEHGTPVLAARRGAQNLAAESQIVRPVALSGYQHGHGRARPSMHHLK